MDNLSKEQRSATMSKIRSKNTTPELVVRKALWKRGYRYRLYYKDEKIDIAFPKHKLAIFIDGCFWHLCPIHGTIPKSNQQYWITKLENNVQRALKKDERLLDSGWTILHIWEHDLCEPELVVNAIEQALAHCSNI